MFTICHSNNEHVGSARGCARRIKRGLRYFVIRIDEKVLSRAEVGITFNGGMYEPKYKISDELLKIIAQIEALRMQVGSNYILPERFHSRKLTC